MILQGKMYQLSAQTTYDFTGQNVSIVSANNSKYYRGNVLIVSANNRRYYRGKCINCMCEQQILQGEMYQLSVQSSAAVAGLKK